MSVTSPARTRDGSRSVRVFQATAGRAASGSKRASADRGGRYCVAADARRSPCMTGAPIAAYGTVTLPQVRHGTPDGDPLRRGIVWDLGQDGTIAVALSMTSSRRDG